MLVLFDIDGTLLLSDRAGVKSMVESGRRLFGPHFSLDGVEIAGRLDPLIWADAARVHDVDDPEGRHAAFRETYAEVLAEHFETRGTARALDGVLPLVARLREMDGVTVGVLTGNYPETGRLKMRAAGIDPGLFPVAAWGSDGASRRDLPPVALDRYADLGGRTVEARRTVIIGDTPHDIDCAHANGCRAIGVATGPSHTRQDLLDAGADLVVDDLTDTEGLVAWMADVCTISAT